MRTERWKYIETRTGAAPDERFRELYDLQTDPHEARNLAAEPAQASRVATLADALIRLEQDVR